MKIGPKYKIARRLGANIFDKTQSPKFAASLARKKKEGRGRPKTDYGIQMLEKQKARFMYGLNERQFRTYVKKALAKKNAKAGDVLFELLESRLDNVIYRLGFANSRAFARQIVSHGHIMVDGIRVTIPSFQVSRNNKIKIREGSAKKKIFEDLEGKLKDVTVPPWIKFDMGAKEAVIEGSPKLGLGESIFDVNAIIQFYQR